MKSLAGESSQDTANLHRWKAKGIWITFWSAPPADDSVLKRVAAEGFNMTWTNEHALDVAAKHGLKVMLQEEAVLKPESLDDPKRLELLDAMIDRVKNHPALGAYFLRDEPSAQEFDGLGRLVAHLRQRDPLHPAFINLLPSYARIDRFGVNILSLDIYGDYLRCFMDKVKPDILSYDHYHFFRNSDPPDFFFNLEKIREAAQRRNLPFINVIQACKWARHWRMPTAQELRFMAYSTLAYGGRGVAYFLYWGPTKYGGLYRDGKPMRVVADVAKLNEEIAALSPVLMDMHSTAVYQTEPLCQGTKPASSKAIVRLRNRLPLVIGEFETSSRGKAFMLVNRNYRDKVVAEVMLPKAAAVSEFDRTSKKWRKLVLLDGQITVPLAAGDGKLFRVD